MSAATKGFGSPAVPSFHFCILRPQCADRLKTVLNDPERSTPLADTHGLDMDFVVRLDDRDL